MLPSATISFFKNGFHALLSGGTGACISAFYETVQPGLIPFNPLDPDDPVQAMVNQKHACKPCKRRDAASETKTRYRSLYIDAEHQ